MTSTAIFIWIIYTVMLLSGILIGKKLKCIAILLLLLNPPAGTSLGFSQVPETNWEIWDAVDSYIGRKVGTGSCKELRDSVLMDARLGTPDSAAVGYYHFTLNDSDTIFPGDLVVFKNAVIDGSTYEHHVAIVFSIENTSDTLLIAHQNAGVSKLKDSKVVVTRLNLNLKERGVIEFHRVVSL